MRWLPRKNLTPNHESTKGSQVQHGGQRMEHDGAIPDGWYHARYIICVLCVVLCKLYTVYIQNTYVDTCIKYIYIHIYIYHIYQSYTVKRVYEFRPFFQLLCCCPLQYTKWRGSWYASGHRRIHVRILLLHFLLPSTRKRRESLHSSVHAHDAYVLDTSGLERGGGTMTVSQKYGLWNLELATTKVRWFRFLVHASANSSRFASVVILFLLSVS